VEVFESLTAMVGDISMTVRELIEQLQKFNPDDSVISTNCDAGVYQYNYLSYPEARLVHLHTNMWGCEILEHKSKGRCYNCELRNTEIVPMVVIE